MLNELFDLDRWIEWFSSLDRSFIFLLTLPFVVALVGLWSAFAEKEPGEAPEEAERRVGERRRRARRREDAGRLSGSRG